MSKVMFAKPKPTKKRAKTYRITRAELDAIAEGARKLTDEFFEGEESDYKNLSKEEFDKLKEQRRLNFEHMLLEDVVYYNGKNGKIELKIRDELTKRCGDEELAERLVCQIYCRDQTAETLMDILVKLLQNHDLCCSAKDIRRQWNEFIASYPGTRQAALKDGLQSKTLEAEPKVVAESSLRPERVLEQEEQEEKERGAASTHDESMGRRYQEGFFRMPRGTKRKRQPKSEADGFEAPEKVRRKVDSIPGGL